MSKLVVCPACGSELIDRSEKESLGQLTLGSEFTFNEVLYKCRDCGEEGDFFAESDKYYLAAQKDAQINFVKQILDDLNNIGITMAFVERVFELPARTLTRWKTGDFSSTAIALLRILKTYSWITEVAEHKFVPSFAKHAVLTAAIKEMVNNAERISNMPYQDVEIKSDSPVISIKKIVTLPITKIGFTIIN